MDPPVGIDPTTFSLRERSWLRSGTLARSCIRCTRSSGGRRLQDGGTPGVRDSGAATLVRIAGAERHPFRHLAPLAGVWGLAPTLPNVLEPRSTAGSVATGSGAHLPLVISRLPGSLIAWTSPASAVVLAECRRVCPRCRRFEPWGTS